MGKIVFASRGEPRVLRRGNSLLLRWQDVRGDDAEFKLDVSADEFKEMTGRKPEEIVISYVGPLDRWNSPAAGKVSGYLLDGVVMHGWFPEQVNDRGFSFMSTVRIGKQRQVKQFVVQGVHHIEGDIRFKTPD